MAVKKREEKVGEALLKVALGCRVEEVTEEYAEVDGELKLTKRRETKKDIPPDLKAVQMLLAAKEDGADYAAMSDEQLNAERERLLAALRETESGADRKGAAARFTRSYGTKRAGGRWPSMRGARPSMRGKCASASFRRLKFSPIAWARNA